MKRNILIILIGILLVMIALPSISQTVYHRNDTTYTCYTNEENRLIATLLVKGEKNKELLEIASSTITLLTSKIVVLESKSTIKDLLITKITEDNKTLFNSNTKLNNDVTTLTKRNGRLKFTTILTTGIAITFGLILFL